ncbi:MAG: SDR family oxidoreductase [Thermomicrobiales bacterium]|nr:SDR family oxidoreductase [Thermomicrobiales bacterium]
MSRFEGKRVFVTGAAQGIGRAISKAFVDEGGIVHLTDLNGDGVVETAKEIGGNSSSQLDVTDKRAVVATVEKMIDDLGGIDVLINNAGTITMRPAVELTEEDWDLNMDVNAKGAFFCIQAVLPHMIERSGECCVVTTASQAGKRGYPLFTHYCASKAAILNFTRAVAVEVAPHVRLNCVCPGIVNTDMMEREYAWETEMTGESKEDIKERWVAGVPMGRFQEPEDIAGVTLFLASDAASEMTGQGINVTGGMVMD